jgi:hypothetical protein
MYPVEAAIVTACHNGPGGTGDVAIMIHCELSHRMVLSGQKAPLRRGGRDIRAPNKLWTLPVYLVYNSFRAWTQKEHAFGPGFRSRYFGNR